MVGNKERLCGPKLAYFEKREVGPGPTTGHLMSEKRETTVKSAILQISQ